ncbi:hypothetical protein IU500_03530 [Nocardia terpenica]|uniref:hypothetical protein n=1 Tax=Nocardia terpenica TaxID=455432 RepID=UPI001893C92F|nr:hypothetical protein [Nocardia terpenica]MBF6059348.1 hypothetical protein [Nocardia terpenica]MBF6103113.1 hypothetical protein [Nocardia terpenica]MBF6110698.1 hypothetical protein [Nocardia terpenica]MBF6116829.1 hypothetical protein [Nocardia terpenica]
MLGSALLSFGFAFLPWWSWSWSGWIGGVSASASDSADAWHRFWWTGVVVALAVAMLYLLAAFAVIPRRPALLALLAYGGMFAFVLTAASFIDAVALHKKPSPRGIIIERATSIGGHHSWGSASASGPAVGIFLTAVSTAVLATCAVLIAHQSGFRPRFPHRR